VFYFDVGLAILKQDFQFSNRINPICLPEISYNSIRQFEEDGLTVQGWSLKNDDYELKEIDVNIKSQEECNYQYDKADQRHMKHYLPNKLQPSQFCAGNYDVNVRTYFGDSGGPAIKREWSANRGARYELLGIVSGKIPRTDDLYVFVAHRQILPWIKSILLSES